MPTYNYKSRELIAKIVYYGPGRCGKTTNLQQIHAKMRPDTRSELLSVATETDRTIYFDLLPLNLGTIGGMKFMVRLFTVPGQIYYSQTRKLVLRGTDGVVFVADSQDHMMDENRQSLQDLKENLVANGLDFEKMPLVYQWNKRDLPKLIPEAELSATLNLGGQKAVSAIAPQGQGVLETLRHITLEVFNHVRAGGKTQLAGGAPPRPGSRQQSTPPPPPTRAPTAPLNTIPKPTAGPPPPPARTDGNGHAPAPKRPPRRASPVRTAGPSPAKISTEMVLEEFQSLALMQGQMAERLSALEGELTRLGKENQEIREILASQTEP